MERQFKLGAYNNPRRRNVGECMLPPSINMRLSALYSRYGAHSKRGMRAATKTVPFDEEAS